MAGDVDLDLSAARGGRGSEASDVLQRMAVERAVQEFINWQQRRAELGNDWVEPTDIANGLLYLTAAELAELRAGLDALIEPLVARRRVGQHADRPPDAEPVSFLSWPSQSRAPSTAADNSAKRISARRYYAADL